jgi:hypothetical protein
LEELMAANNAVLVKSFAAQMKTKVKGGSKKVKFVPPEESEDEDEE